MGCQHDWYERERFKTTPLQSINCTGLSAHQVERLMLGVTTLVMECRRPQCHEVRTHEIIGQSAAKLTHEAAKP